jgi:hypothetical protein
MKHSKRNIYLMKPKRLPCNDLDFTTNREILKLIRARIRSIYRYYKELDNNIYTSFARKEIAKLNKAYKILR